MRSGQNVNFFPEHRFIKAKKKWKDEKVVLLCKKAGFVNKELKMDADEA
jgi:hypothetical protein